MQSTGKHFKVPGLRARCHKYSGWMCRRHCRTVILVECIWKEGATGDEDLQLITPHYGGVHAGVHGRR